MKPKKFDVGVVVGRFQVPKLHPGHVALIERVADQCHNALVLVGVAPALGTKEDPLDFMIRARMINRAFPSVMVLPLMDRPSDEEWSKNLDTLVRATFPLASVRLFGGRDSFKKHYKGDFQVQEISTVGDHNGTDARKLTGKVLIDTPEFRAGVIYSTQNRYPRLHMTIDVALVKRGLNNGKLAPHDNQVLLGRRRPKDPLIFPGGFVDPTDDSLEMAAVRELDEETGLSGHGESAFEYVGSFLVNDWRYRKDERIMTALFMVDHTWGTPKPTPELEELAFFAVEPRLRAQVSPGHQVLFDALMKRLKRREP